MKRSAYRFNIKVIVVYNIKVPKAGIFIILVISYRNK